MSPDGETSNRLSDALDQIFSRPSTSGRPSDEAAASEAEDAGAHRGDTDRDNVDQDDVGQGNVDQDDADQDDAYVMPEIVPATEPTLPGREPRPSAQQAVPSAPAAATPAPAPAAPAPAAAPTWTPSASTDTAAARPTTSWSDHVGPSAARGSGLRTPGRRPRVRRVTRVLRHIDPWSTFKVGLLFSLVAYLVALTSGVLLWRVADSTGTLDNVERWFTQFGWETFELDGGEVFHNAWIIGLFLVVGTTGGLVLLATVFNLVSDIIGGVRLTVLEEEVVERTISSTRRYVVRQGPAAAGAAVAPAQEWDVDDDDGAVRTPAPDPEPPPSSAAPAQDWTVD